jgi:transposase
MTRKHSNKKSIAPPSHRGARARAGGRTLQSCTIGVLPIVNQLLDRMQLESFLKQHLPRDGRGMAVPTSRCLLLLLRNILLSREPIYGLGEWAERWAPELLDLKKGDLEHLNDDRIGRSLDRLFQTNVQELVLDVVRHVVKEFDVSLDELHNDSTTVSFYGAYENAAEETKRGRRTRLAITFGHSKDRRPDLKQLLYILTVTDDGGVPLYFTTASGNVTDDTTHRETWDLLRQLLGRADFLYVADCKLATRENLQYIHNQGGRFVTILPRTRREDSEFRQQLLASLDAVKWEHLYDITREEGELLDRLRVCTQGNVSSEGFRLLWFHSTRKAQRDARSRARALDRASKQLAHLQSRLHSSRTRFRQRDKVELAVQEILGEGHVSRWLKVQILEFEEETFKQATPGRPGKNTQYIRETTRRYKLSWTTSSMQIEHDQATDGVFPLITNQHEMTPEQVLRAYKRQPLIEKRFSQFKSDFEVAPIYLKEVTRIEAMLAMYFFALMLQTLLERELRQALENSEYESLPLYPEHRACRAPTTRRIVDIFETVQRHQLTGGGDSETFVTQLTPLQAQIAKWFEIHPNQYGRSMRRRPSEIPRK